MKIKLLKILATLFFILNISANSMTAVSPILSQPEPDVMQVTSNPPIISGDDDPSPIRH